jgi:predicted RNA-binding protein YlqC (UPF0109 family)
MLINKQFTVTVGHNNYEGPSQIQLYLHDSHTGRIYGRHTLKREGFNYHNV